jgi:hypothetical protein
MNIDYMAIFESTKQHRSIRSAVLLRLKLRLPFLGVLPVKPKSIEPQNPQFEPPPTGAGSIEEQDSTQSCQ